MQMFLILVLCMLTWFSASSMWRRQSLKKGFEDDTGVVKDEEKLASENWTQRLPSYINVKDLHTAFSLNFPNSLRKPDSDNDNVARTDFFHCQMESCFNFDRCKDSFKVYVYPIDPLVPTSPTYDKILNGIISSPYYTNDPTQACIFILSIDTLDRDELSREFVRNVPTRLKKIDVSLHVLCFP